MRASQQQPPVPSQVHLAAPVVAGRMQHQHIAARPRAPIPIGDPRTAAKEPAACIARHFGPRLEIPQVQYGQRTGARIARLEHDLRTGSDLKRYARDGGCCNLAKYVSIARPSAASGAVAAGSDQRHEAER
jgi:hypothetical protein